MITDAQVQALTAIADDMDESCYQVEDMEYGHTVCPKHRLLQWIADESAPEPEGVFA